MHLRRQIEKLKKMILELGALVEESLVSAIQAIEQRDPELAQRVIEQDALIDAKEIDIEEECLHTLALYQPVAFDLRFIVAVLKINSDLERIGDHAVNLAERALVMMRAEPLDEPPFDLRGMARSVRSMLRKALNALVNIDVDLATEVRRTDDDVDAIHGQANANISRLLREEPAKSEPLIQLLDISHNLERVADHAVNIAEDILYMARGDIMRHQPESPES